MTLIDTHDSIESLAQALRDQEKKYTLLFAYNGTGKTHLSMQFKDMGKEKTEKDTLYFNAFTEDLFTWDNDFENDSIRKLKMNIGSKFFKGLEGLAIEDTIFSLLSRYANFEFKIDYEKYKITFHRNVDGDNVENIKISRGKENIQIQ